MANIIFSGEQYCLIFLGGENSPTAQGVCYPSLREALQSLPPADPEAGVMVAIYPPPTAARAISALLSDLFPTLPPNQRVPEDQFHITLAYLGRVGEVVDLQALSDSLISVASATSPLFYRISGMARFAKIQEDGRTPLVLLIDSEELRAVRTVVIEALDAAGVPFHREHDFTPHITVAHMTDEVNIARDPLTLDLPAENLCLSYGIHRFEFPLKTQEVVMTDISEVEVLERGVRAEAAIDFSQHTREQLLADPSLPVPFVASSEGMKRDGHNLKLQDWDLSRFMRYGPILWIHDPKHPTLGRGEAFLRDKLKINVYYDQFDSFAQLIRRKAIQGMMAGSVGWDKIKYRATGAIKNLLLEFSMTPLGIDEDSLPEIERLAVASYGRSDEFWRTVLLEDGNDPQTVRIQIERSAIPPHTTAKADEGTAWDAGAVVSSLEGKEALRRTHAWVSSEGDPETKDAYKLPHHDADGRVVWRGVAAAMSRLMQAGTQIPEADREGVFRHLAAHYRQFGKETPERAMVATHWRAGETELFPELFMPKGTGGAVAQIDLSDFMRSLGELNQKLGVLAERMEAADKDKEAPNETGEEEPEKDAPGTTETPNGEEEDRPDDVTHFGERLLELGKILEAIPT